MTVITLVVAITGVLVFATPRLAAQGCSDAGVCTIGTVQAGFDDNFDDNVDAEYKVPKLLHLQLQTVYGAGENGVSIVQVVPEASWTAASPITRGILTIQASLPWAYATGSLGSNSGVGDAMISVSNTALIDHNTNVGLTVGMRLPTGTTNATTAGSPLPMPYQTGLGTTDLLLGASASMGPWALALGYQHVAVNGNTNAFTDSGSGYFSSKDLERGDDAVVRLTYAFNAGDLAITPSVLAIYRLHADRVAGAEVSGSRGLTLNAAVAGRYVLSHAVDLRIDLAMPLRVREVRPDGLTRGFVAALTVGVGL